MSIGGKVAILDLRTHDAGASRSARGVIVTVGIDDAIRKLEALGAIDGPAAAPAEQQRQEEAAHG